MAAPRIAITILTGFLGSGKTTVLNHLLRDARLADTAVIVNELGEIGLDHLLVERAVDQMVLLENGCVCCSVRGDLVDTLEDLVRRATEGLIPPFHRVVIETTGLADPGPIVDTLLTDAATVARFRLQGLVTTIDAVHGLDTLSRYDEARAQAAMADLALITKADMPEADVPGVRRAAAALNADVPTEIVENGRVDPAVVLSAGTIDTAKLMAMVASAMAGAPHGPSAHPPHHDLNHDPHWHRHSAHAWNVATAAVVVDEPLPWQLVAGWLNWLTALRGPDILRIKGLVHIAGLDKPVLIQGVQHVFHPPRILDEWPDGDHRSRIIIIARDIPADALRHSLRRYRAHCSQMEGVGPAGIAREDRT